MDSEGSVRAYSVPPIKLAKRSMHWEEFARNVRPVLESMYGQGTDPLVIKDGNGFPMAVILSWEDYDGQISRLAVEMAEAYRKSNRR